MGATAQGRERQPYKLNAVAEGLRAAAQRTDMELEEAIAELCASYEDDGQLDDDEFRRVLISFVRAYRENSELLSVLDLLDLSGSEAALRKLELLQAKQRHLTLVAKGGA